MKTTSWIGQRWAAVIVGGLGVMGGTAICLAQPPRNPDAVNVRGSIVRMTTAPKGEVDGAVLDDGTWLHWPPHLETRFTKVIEVGDRVEAKGRSETGPRGDSRFEVQSVTDVRTRSTIENPDFNDGPRPGPKPHERRGPRPPRPRNDSPFTTVRGVAQQFTTAPKGEIDGVILDDGTSLHWPPHLAERFAEVIKKGDTVDAVGRNETAPHGEQHFEVQSITNVRSGMKAINPDLVNDPVQRAAEFRESRPDAPMNRDQKLRDLQSQIDRLQRELDRLRVED